MLEQSYSPLRTSWWVVQWSFFLFFSIEQLFWIRTTLFLILNLLNVFIGHKCRIYLWVLLWGLQLKLQCLWWEFTTQEMGVLDQIKPVFESVGKLFNHCVNMIDQVPLCVLVAWIMGIRMDLDFSLLETSSLALAIIVTAFTLQVRFSWTPISHA